MSLELINELEVQAADRVIDIGGGASMLARALVAIGFTDVHVLDVSAVALAEARRRNPEGSAISWHQEDVLTWEPSERYMLWHDRAVFHFLTEESDVGRYLHTMQRALARGAAVVMATFAEDGPEYCSGLPVRRYSTEELIQALGAGFRTEAVRRQLHTTPSGAIQPFSWIAGRMAPSH
jgi:hypothetical protein